MPNIFKAFSRAKAEPYQFPSADELIVDVDPEVFEELLPPLEEGELPQVPP